MEVKSAPSSHYVRQGLLQYFKFLGDELGEHRQSRDIAAGPGQSSHVAHAYRVGMGSEDDGYRLSRLSSGLHFGRRSRENDLDIHADQFGRVFIQPVYRFRPQVVDPDILAFNIAELAQSGPECVNAVNVSSGRTKP